MKGLKVVSIVLALLLVVANMSFAGTTERVSVDNGGNEANGDSRYPELSADGRFVIFASLASNLVPGDTNGMQDVFVYDRETGLIERVSVDSYGSEGNRDSWPGTFAENGRYVLFMSYANNLVPGDTNGSGDIFVHDRETGITERVSVDSNGNQSNGFNVHSIINADGRYVAFASDASNLVPGDTNRVRDIFIHDRETGVTERVSVDNNGNQGNGESRNVSISADGRYITFKSVATNLVPGDTNGTVDVFVRDRERGITERVSVDSNGNQLHNYSPLKGGHRPFISADGRYVTFNSEATDLVPGDTNGVRDIFVHDRETGVTERVSVDSSGNQGNNSSTRPNISSDNRYVAFYSSASNLVAGDTNGKWDIFVHDRKTGETERVNVDNDGNQGNGDSLNSFISADGRSVAFYSYANNLVFDDANGVQDVFVHDRGPLCDERPNFEITSFRPDVIWPPNHKIIEVVVAGSVIVPDGCTLQGAGYSIEDEYGVYTSNGELDVDAEGNFEIALEVEASRKGNDRDGRQYSISFTAEDEAGEQSVALEVNVPHDQRK